MMLKGQTDNDSPRLLRTAGWLWLGYLLALLLIDQVVYQMLGPLLTYYLLNLCVALVFLGMAYWDEMGKWLDRFYLPLMLILISALPLVTNHLLLPRLPPGPMLNAEGMALRQIPVLFVALVLVAWRYGLGWVLVFSVGTALVELASVDVLSPLVRQLYAPRLPRLPVLAPVPLQAIDVFLFVALVRTVSFIVVGAFISQLVDRLHAQQQSLARANSRLTHYAATLESLAVSRERNRLAHELHDTLAHSLTGISVQLETVKAYWDIDPEQARARLDDSLAATRRGIDETRRALKSLRASPLEEMGLALAVRSMAESTAARHGLSIDLSLPNSLPPLSPDVEQCIYRVAQEAIENAVVHADPSILRLSLTQSGACVQLIVQDDGAGFDPQAAEKTGHFGLLGMRERARLVGGTLDVASRPGRGAIVTLTIG